MQPVTGGDAEQNGQIAEKVALPEPSRLMQKAVRPLEAGTLHPPRRAKLFAGEEVE